MEYLKLSNDENIETLFKVVPPLQELDNGHGYMGVVLRDKSEDTLQCHICGRWFKGLAHHVRAHKIRLKDYRRLFGLPMGFPLVGRSVSRKISQNSCNNKKAKLKQLASARDMKKLHSKKSRRKAKKGIKEYKNSPAYENIKGLCPEQIVRRYLIVADIVGHEPTQRELMKYDEPLFGGIIRRYKTINKFRMKNGFSVVKKSKVYTDDDLISILRGHKYKYGRTPSSYEFRSKKPSANTIRNHFGSWNRALMCSGLN